MKGVLADTLVGVTLVLLLVSLVGCNRPGRQAGRRLEPTGMETAAAMMADTSMEAIVVDGQVRSYHLHVPPTYQAGSPLPLVLNFHGYNSNAAQEEQVSRMSDKADAVGFIVAYPEGLGQPQSWKFGGGSESAADVAFARALIADLESRYAIKSDEIFATGISNGAEMSYRLACDLADKLAAVGLVSGGYPPFRDCEPARPVAVVIFHGTADNLLAYDGQPPVLLPVRDWAAGWAERNGCNSTPTVTFQQGDVIGETWSGCRDQAEVVLYTIEGKGHSWPGSDMPAQITTQDIDATDVMWDFFAAHPYPGR